MANDLFAPPSASEMQMGASSQSLFTPPSKDEMAMGQPSWLDTSILGHTPRNVIQGGLNALPTVGMVAGGLAGAETGPGAIVTAGAGAAGGTALKNLGEQYLLGQDKTRSEIYGDPARSVVEGAGAEMGGKLIGAGASALADTTPGQYVINKASQIPKWAAGKIGRLFTPVTEETTARYLENPTPINTAAPREQISDQVLGLKANAQDQLEKAQEELVNAKGDAADKKQAYKEALKNTNLTSMVGNVHEAIGNLKNQVVKGSSDAYNILDNADGKIQTQPLIKLIQDHIEDLHVNGVPKSPSAAQAISELQAYQQNLSQMGIKKIPGPKGTWSIDNSISLPEAKQVLQGLDKTISWKNPVGSFAPETDQALGSLRTAIDQDVKGQVPEYAKKMGDVSRQTRLLKAASENFGTPEKAISNLNNIDSQKGTAVHLPIIEALGKESGQDLSSPVNDFVAKQKILSTPSLFEKMVNETPEVKRVSAAQSSLDEAKDKTKLFAGVTPDSITSKTKALNGANQYGAQAKFGPIDDAYGTNFQKQIQARNDADQFAKEGTHGSRMAVIGGTIGGAIGHVAGGTEGAVLGASLGAQAGGTVDKYGGQIFKSFLDKGMATKSAIKAGVESMPNAPSLVGQGATGAMPSAPTFPHAASNNTPTTPQKGPDKWAQDGFQNLKGHVNDDDREWLEENKSALMLDPQAKKLLVTGSNFSPGTKPLDDIIKHLKDRLDDEE